MLSMQKTLVIGVVLVVAVAGGAAAFVAINNGKDKGSSDELTLTVGELAIGGTFHKDISADNGVSPFGCYRSLYGNILRERKNSREKKGGRDQKLDTFHSE